MSNGLHSQPKNLEDVLHMAVGNTTAEQPTLNAMSEERKQFLQEALGAVGSAVDRMKEILSHVQTYINSTDEEVMTGLQEELEELSEWCEDIDNACDFYKIGGFAMFPIIRNKTDAELQWRCNDLIGSLCQNNPYCQQKILEETKEVDKLIAMVKDEGQTEMVQVKAIYALSCLLRNNASCQQVLISKGVLPLLLHAMHQTGKIRTKALFLLMALMRDDEDVTAQLTKMECVEKLIAILHSQHQPDHEHVMAALLQLFTNNPLAVEHALNTDLRQVLIDRISLLSDLPEFEEEVMYAGQLKTILESSHRNQ